MKISIAALFFAGSALVASCTHTNELAKYDTRGKTAFYSYYVAGGALQSGAIVQAPPSKSGDNGILDVAAAIGSAAAGGIAQSKLDRAVRPDSLAAALAKGMENSIALYLQMKPLANLEDGPDYVVQTSLDECVLSSSTVGISARVEGTSRIIARSSGKVIWENSESKTVPLRSTSLAAGGFGSIISAAQLSSLSETELSRVMLGAAEEAGREMGETLREDVAKLNR